MTQCSVYRVRAAWALLACGFALAACAPDAQSDRLVQHVSESDARWPFWPDDFRVHPLTRLVVDAEGKALFIEARIEFIDPDGHTSKACGELRLEIHDAGVRRGVDPLVWERMDLGDLEFNRTYFDEITRTYVFRLELAAGQVLPDRPLLVAYYLSVHGAAFDTREFEVRTK